MCRSFLRFWTKAAACRYVSYLVVYTPPRVATAFVDVGKVLFRFIDTRDIKRKICGVVYIVVCSMFLSAKRRLEVMVTTL